MKICKYPATLLREPETSKGNCQINHLGKLYDLTVLSPSVESWFRREIIPFYGLNSGQWITTIYPHIMPTIGTFFLGPPRCSHPSRKCFGRSSTPPLANMRAVLVWAEPLWGSVRPWTKRNEAIELFIIVLSGQIRMECWKVYLIQTVYHTMYIYIYIYYV